ncbi:hypothetical protein SUGI_0281770 [Cryptomeria japonica]|nr:hypothetical protein SUGI_0281770 [Cryptomeria japonica]
MILEAFRAEAVYLVIGVSILSWVLWQCLSSGNRRAGPLSWPVVGMLPSVFLHLHEIYEWSSEVLIQSGGTLDFKPPWMTKMFTLVTIDPRNIEYMVKTKFGNFPKGAYFNSIFQDLMGKGILNVDGKEWAGARKIMSSIFHSHDYKSHLIQTLEELVKCRLLPVAQAACESGAVVDLQQLLVRFTFENMCVVGFGLNPKAFEKPEAEAIARAFDDALDATVRRFIIPSTLWKLMRFLGFGSEEKLNVSLQLIHSFLHRLISLRRHELVGDGTDRRHDLLSKLMMQAEAEHSLTNETELRDTCINFVLAGRDTSSVALSWFFWLLTQNPSVERKILGEIEGVIKRRRSRGEPEAEELRVEDMKEMQYLHAALSESLRLYPSLPINFKEVKEREVLPDGRVLAKGTSLMFSIYGMGRAESIWGSDCREFKPERWLKEGVYVAEKASKYPVFNAGPRVCPGKDFAYLQMKLVAVLLVYRYRMEAAEGVVVVPKLGVNLFMKNGLLVTLHPRHTTPNSLD